jgi:hypothetical protein
MVLLFLISVHPRKSMVEVFLFCVFSSAFFAPSAVEALCSIRDHPRKSTQSF